MMRRSVIPRLMHDRSSEAARATARARRAAAHFITATHRPAGLVRPPSPQAAVARARRASAPIRTASGCPRSCCSRRRSRRSRPITRAFSRAGPTSRALAAAPLDDVLKAWAGLGYYARARNLHACARAVVERHGGQFPASEAALRALPGIGAYTAAAIAAIAFDRPATPVDGNIERVIARLYAVERRCRRRSRKSRRLAAALTPQRRAGDFAQAMMDLGATICTPKNPACALCPWNDAVARPRARRSGDLSAAHAETRRRACAAAPPLWRAGPTALCCADAPGEGSARRHDRSADDGMDARFRRSRTRSTARRVFAANEALAWRRAPAWCGTSSRIFRSSSLSMRPTCPPDVGAGRHALGRDIRA